MSRKRWKMDELKKISNAKFIMDLLQERRNECTNPYSPLYQRITEAIEWVMPGYEIQRVFTVSTAHITAEDNEKLEAETARDDVPALIVDSFKYGFYIYVNLDPKEDKPEEDELNWDFSDALKKLIQLARKLKCNYIKLDRDGETYSDLETFDW